MTPNNTPPLSPTAITGYWLENDDFLSEFALLNSWSPFETACLICNWKPDPIVGGKARVGRVPDTDLGEDYNQDAQDGWDAEGLINLTKIIIRNFDSQPTIPSIDVVRWAVNKELLRPKSYLARRVIAEDVVAYHIDTLGTFDGNEPARLLAEAIIKRADAAEARIDSLHAEIDRLRKSTKDTGKHHAENRTKILGAALHELSQSHLAPYIKDGKLVAAKFAEHLHDHRHRYNLPDTHGLGADNIRNTVLDALGSAKKSE